MEEQNYLPEKDLQNVPDSVPLDNLEIIIEQCKNSICKIKSKSGGNGTGFFIVIPFPDKFHQLPVLMTNNHVIPKDELNQGDKIRFTINNDKKFFEILIDNSIEEYLQMKNMM